MKKTTLIIIILVISLNIIAQKSNIIGFVEDATTGERLVNATIQIKNTKYATLTNEYGYFNFITDNLDSVMIVCSYLGYLPDTLITILNKELFLDFKLFHNNCIDSIIISSDIPIEKRNEMGLISLPINQIKTISTIMGETDLMKVFQLMPGIESGSEGKSDLYVRGGNPDENLVLLDDVPLYYLNHFGGFISIFNIDAINSVNMLKGGFPARYGSRLSSIIDIRMKEGNLKKTQGNFSVGILSTKFYIEGPIKKNKASYIISARVFPWYRILAPFTMLSYGEYFGYDFYDLNAKLNYKINSKNHIFLSLYSGKDDVFFKLQDLSGYNKYNCKLSTKWGNTLIALRWNILISKKIFVNTTLSNTYFNYDIMSTTSDFSEKRFNSYSFNSSIKDFILKSTFDYKIKSQYKIKFGYNIINHNFNPGITYLINNENEHNDTLTYGNNKASAWESRFFIENQLDISNIVSSNFGFHFSDFYYKEKHYNSIQPRIIISFFPIKNTSFKSSYAEMQQYTHLITSSSMASSVNLWIPSEDTLPPSKSKQWSIGIYKSFVKINTEFSVELYYKTTDNLIEFKEGTLLGGIADNWKNKIETNGIGVSKGIEFMIQKKVGKLNGWISYTLAKSDIKFNNINNNNFFPTKYDRRHNFSVVFSYLLKKDINISLNWIYGSGYPYTIPIAKYNTIDEVTNEQNEDNQIFNQQAYLYSYKNSFRMKAYHRLDFSVKFTKEKKKCVRIWNISIYNVYNRQNPYFYYYLLKNDELKLYQVSFFPIIPSISYSLKF